jgi:membrane dipeptidase
VGIDHVGLSGDFDGGGGVKGWDNAAESPNVTAGLMKRGYSEQDIAKIWGGNILRVMRDVQAIAKTKAKM